MYWNEVCTWNESPESSRSDFEMQLMFHRMLNHIPFFYLRKALNTMELCAFSASGKKTTKKPQKNHHKAVTQSN